MITITSSCHCKRFTYPLEVDETTLPVLDTTCNCTSCRRRTGQIAIFPFPASSLPPKEHLDLLTPYASFNEATKTTVTSYYCSTCGSKLLIAISDSDGKHLGGGWMLGCLDKTEGLMDIHGHSFLEDTVDGGVSQVWTTSKGKALGKFQHGDEPWTEPVQPRSTSSTTSQYLHLHCHCSSFSVYVSRPNPTLPLPKNCYWYRPPKNPDTGLPTRYMASFCACTSCRITTGSCLPAHPWVQIPFMDIHSSISPLQPYLRDGTTMTPTTDLPNLTRYNSSSADSNIARYFCSKCGATVLYFDGSRSFIGTWAVGLVDAEEGVMAQRWLNWWTGMAGHPNPPIHCADEAVDKQMMLDFEKGLIDWGKRTRLEDVTITK